MVEYENLARSNQKFIAEIQEKVSEVVAGGWYVLGKEVSAFEREFAAFCGSRFAVGVGNGMDAMTLSLKSIGLSAGAEIIVPSNTYIATILSVIHAGYVPVLVEPKLDSYNIDPELIESAISPQTEAILIVHLYGKPCEMGLILELCNKHRISLVEDCAQAHGAKYNGKMVGSFGIAGCFSFYPTKNLGAMGDGGAVVIDCSEVEMSLRTLRNYGSDTKYRNLVVGYNSRLDEIQAAILRVKLRYLDEINNHKRRLALIYNENLKGDYILPKEDSECHDVFHIYAVRHSKRDELKKYLASHDIHTEVHYPIPPHMQKALRGCFNPSVNYPIAEEIHKTILSLPCSFMHSEDDVMKVVAIMNKF